MTDWVKAGELIDCLRDDEGAVVLIHGDNPDFNGLPNCAIGIIADWTGWDEETIRADTIVACLEKALFMRPTR